MPQRLILVIGPSGIGKSVAFRIARHAGINVAFDSMDHLTTCLGQERGIINANQGIRDLWSTLNADDSFLSLGIEAVSKFQEKHSGKAVVIDVGAGFLDASGARTWLAEHTTIAFWAPAEVAYGRLRQKSPNDPRTLPDYEAQEFSSNRQCLYSQATHTVVADCASPEELARRLIQVLCGIPQEPG